MLVLLSAGCGERMAFRDRVEIDTSSPSVPFKHAVWRDLEPSDDGAILIQKDSVVLDIGGGGWSRGQLEGGALECPPDQFSGRGIVVRGAKNVTIRNMKIRGFKVAIYAEDAPGLIIESCDVSNNYRQHLKSTPEKEDESDWLYGHENDNNEWLRYGAGIYLLRCDGATVKNCRARNGQNGICLVRCNDATIVGNDMSFMSGWGLAMWRSSRCKVIGNRFDYCVRGYSHGVYARGQDSAGILVYEQCSDNVFAYNHATHGGDGFFLYAGNETVNKTGEGGCNRNLVYQNNFSYAVANGIEATFSDQNVFLENTLSNCVHGVWAGYSSKSLVAGNVIESCENGVSIEHGRRNQIYRNRFTNCNRGIWLWWDDDRDLLPSPYAKKQGAACEGETIRQNALDKCSTAIQVSNAQSIVVETNDLTGCAVNLLAQGDRQTWGDVSGNECEGGRVVNDSEGSLTQFAFSGVDEFVGNLWFVTSDYPVARKNMPKPGLPDERLLWESVSESNIPEFPKQPPDRVGTKQIIALPHIPEGKEHIVITEWGPWDFTGERPKRTATTQSASGK